MTPAERPTVKKIRAEIERLAITEQSAGCSIDELIRQARENDDPLAFLSTYVDPAAEPSRQPASETQGTGDSGQGTGKQGTGFAAAPPIEPEPQREFAHCTISAPLGELPMEQVRAGKYYVSRHLEVQLSGEQAIALRRIVLGLDGQRAKLRNGKRVFKGADAIRWLLEQINES